MNGLFQIKASAGSGKTHTLTERILSLLVEGNQLSQIIAITFTNAAAEEMRSRVLSRLKSAALGLDTKLLPKNQAKQLLSDILYNYSALNVRTIDSLLLQIVRTSSLKIHLNPDFDPVFNTSQTVEPFLEILSVRARQGDERLARQLDSLVRSLYLEGQAHGFLAGKKIQNLLAPLFSAILLKQCEDLMPASQVRQLRTETQEKLVELAASLLAQAGQAKWKKQAQNALQLLAHNELKALDSAFLAKDSLAELFCKNEAAADNAQLCALYSQLLTGKTRFRLFNEAVKTLPFIELGRRMADAFMASEDAGRFLHTVVVPSLVCAIFEGYLPVEETLFLLGNDTRHVLIDEFQDTSDDQWLALSHLVEEALAKGGSFTWVGDVKQSIFSWRGGNPELFDQLLQDSHLLRLVAKPDRHTENLPCNWRSLPTLIDFNNRLYQPLENAQTCREIISRCLAKDLPASLAQEAGQKLALAFAKHHQSYPQNKKTDQTGSVQLRTTTAETLADDVLAQLVAWHQHRPWSQMLVLVRKNREALELAQTLLAQGIPVVTENSLLLAQQSLIIQSLALLRFLLLHDQLAFYTLLSGEIFATLPEVTQSFSLTALCEDYLREHDLTLEQCFRQRWPELWKKYFASFARSAALLSPYDLLSEWYSFLGVAERFPKERIFTRRLLEILHLAEDKGAGTISAFLEYWQDNHEEEKVPLPENMDAVRIMTIHKAKGLEAPCVLFPWKMVPITARTELLFTTTEEGRLATLLNKNAGEIYYRSLLRDCQETLNILYVATTRAREELCVLRCQQNRSDDKDLLKILVEMAGLEMSEALTDRPDPLPSAAEASEPHQPAQSGEENLPTPMQWLPSLRIAHSRDQDEAEEARRRGILLHKALQYVLWQEDPVKAADTALRFGLARLDPRRLLKENLANDKARDLARHSLVWFLGQKEAQAWLTCGLREHSLLDNKGQLVRFDLLVPEGDSYLVLDYKSGQPKENDIWQMRNYLALLAKSGKNARALLVYLEIERLQLVTESQISPLLPTFALCQKSLAHEA
ncbi:MAG: UvrD-helicase domain-containing protein [Desulfovibrio sp.]|nr:UvrD-helicase domain-containing protein [Desulfovibrio sp.]